MLALAFHNAGRFVILMSILPAQNPVEEVCNMTHPAHVAARASTLASLMVVDQRIIVSGILT